MPRYSEICTWREVHRELDYLKSAKDNNISFKSRNGSRLISEILQADQIASGSTSQRRFPLLRGQQDNELYRDDGHHRAPERLRHDDAILNCCLYFARKVHPPRTVILLSGDRNLRQFAIMNGIDALELKNVNFYAIGSSEV